MVTLPLTDLSSGGGGTYVTPVSPPLLSLLSHLSVDRYTQGRLVCHMYRSIGGGGGTIVDHKPKSSSLQSV